MEKKKRSTAPICFIITKILVTLVPAIIITALLIVFRDYHQFWGVGEAFTADYEIMNMSSTEELYPTPSY